MKVGKKKIVGLSKKKASEEKEGDGGDVSNESSSNGLVNGNGHEKRKTELPEKARKNLWFSQKSLYRSYRGNHCAPLQQEELVNADKEASIEILCQNGGSSNQNGVPSNIITNPPSEVGKHQGIRECKKTTQRSSCHANKVSQVLHWTFIPMERNSAFWSTRNRKDHACKGCCNGVQHNIF